MNHNSILSHLMHLILCLQCLLTTLMSSLVSLVIFINCATDKAVKLNATRKPTLRSVTIQQTGVTSHSPTPTADSAHSYSIQQDSKESKSNKSVSCSKSASPLIKNNTNRSSIPGTNLLQHHKTNFPSTDHTQSDSVDAASGSGSRSHTHVTYKEYKEELKKASKPSPKGPEYEEFEYIRGPFSIYTKLKMKRLKKLTNDSNTKKSSSTFTNSKENDKFKLLGSTPKGSQIQRFTRVTFELKAKGRGIPRDQLRPHKLRKDRQIKNPYRKIYVQNKLKEIGGFILENETGKYIEANSIL